MSLPPSFAETGLHIVRTGQTPIKRYEVLGERCSGTNFIKRLVRRNTSLTPTAALGWKHGFPRMMAVPSDMAVLCVVRSADSWTRSLFTKPWHTTAAMQELPFSEFIRAEWDTIIDRPRYFRSLIGQNCVGTPLQHDRNPVTGLRFENLFALRQAKIAALMSMLNRNCTCVFVRLETARSEPQATRDTILSGLGMPPRTAPFRPVFKRLGARFKPAIANRPGLPEAWADNDSAFLRASIDQEQEAALGYTYS